MDIKQFGSGSFDFLHSVTFTHDCEDERIETSVSGIQVSIPRRGLLTMTMVDNQFCGRCATCGEVLACLLAEMGQILHDQLT